MKSKTKQSSPLKTSPKNKTKTNSEYLTHCEQQNLNTTSTTFKKSKQNKTKTSERGKSRNVDKEIERGSAF